MFIDLYAKMYRNPNTELEILQQYVYNSRNAQHHKEKSSQRTPEQGERKKKKNQ